MAYVAHFRVLDQKIKSKFSHFVVEKFPIFKLPEELKSFLVAKHPAIVRPAEDINFKVGYFIEGKGNRKFDIIDENTLAQAYENSKNNRVTLWLDPHTPVVTSTKTAAKKRSANTDEDEDTELAPPPKTRKESNVEKHLTALKEKFSDDFPEFKLRAWAVMVASGSYKSLDYPPPVPFFKKGGEKRKNDLGGTQTQSSTMTKVDIRGSLLKQLKDLKDLLDTGVLNDREYEEQKSIILQNLKDL